MWNSGLKFILFWTLLHQCKSEEPQALFIKQESLPQTRDAVNGRNQRSNVNNVDEGIENVLKWINRGFPQYQHSEKTPAVNTQQTPAKKSLQLTKQNRRQTRPEGSIDIPDRQYIPIPTSPPTTQRPRPFTSQSGYNYPGNPQPPFPPSNNFASYPSPSFPGSASFPGSPSFSSPSPFPSYPSQSPSFSSPSPPSPSVSSPSPSAGYPSQASFPSYTPAPSYPSYPSPTQQDFTPASPSSSTFPQDFPSQSFPGSQTFPGSQSFPSYPSSASYPQPPSNGKPSTPSQLDFPSFPSQQQPTFPSQQQQPTFPSSEQQPSYPSSQQQPSFPSSQQQPSFPSSQQPQGPQPSFPQAPQESFSPAPPSFVSQTPGSFTPGSFTPTPPNEVVTGVFNGNSKHVLAHIHDLQVQCGKDRMTINIEFDKAYEGIIYSKGFYNNPQCRYVQPNSNEIKYTIDVQLNSCGTEFIDEFNQGRPAYLENVLVFQNEPGIQECWDFLGVEDNNGLTRYIFYNGLNDDDPSVPYIAIAWDFIKRVRCTWEKHLNKSVSVGLSVDKIKEDISNFSGDTAEVNMDVKVGYGPYNEPATGLIKIGEPMTLVVSVDGDPDFDIGIYNCFARDTKLGSETGNSVALTDDNGCILKHKVLGSFQKATNPQTNSKIAFAYFQAFKFPEQTDLYIGCDIHLVKGTVDICPYEEKKYEPGARRRRNVDSPSYNVTKTFSLRRKLSVFSPEDVVFKSQYNQYSVNSPPEGEEFVNVGVFSASDSTVCLSTPAFLISSLLLVSISIISALCSSVLWVRLHMLKKLLRR